MNATNWPGDAGGDGGRAGHPSDLLPEYVRGGATERERIERHLSACARCREEVELIKALAASRPERLSAAEREYAFDRFWQGRRIERSPLTTVWRVAAAIALLLTGIGVWQVIGSAGGAGEWSPGVALEAWERDLEELQFETSDVMLALGYRPEQSAVLWDTLEGVDPAELIGPWEEEQ